MIFDNAGKVTEGIFRIDMCGLVIMCYRCLLMLYCFIALFPKKSHSKNTEVLSTKLDNLAGRINYLIPNKGKCLKTNKINGKPYTSTTGIKV